MVHYALLWNSAHPYRQRIQPWLANKFVSSLLCWQGIDVPRFNGQTIVHAAGHDLRVSIVRPRGSRPCYSRTYSTEPCSFS